jgi:ATP-dependent Clp protease ATP-binding subunit ClpB
LEAELKTQVIGQDEALRAVSNAIIRSRAGLSEENRPQATFLFIGPTGVGKTETAKVLADVLFNDRRALVRLDMSEYSERHTVARLIGAPPGYVGYEEGGQLTESVRRKPYSILLLDEIEKAHPAIFNLMLQIFDDGQLTDGQGRTVNFKNTIIIMTSNLGAKIISEAKGKIDETVKSQINDLIQQTFPPEFINRLDQIIMYEPLSQTDMVKIVDKELTLLQKRLDKQDISLTVDDEVKKHLAQAGFDPIYGARPLKRVIQAEIIDPLASVMLKSQGSKNKFQASLKDETILIR